MPMEISVIVSGPLGSGKTAVLLVIAKALEDAGLLLETDSALLDEYKQGPFIPSLLENPKPIVLLHERPEYGNKQMSEMKIGDPENPVVTIRTRDYMTFSPITTRERLNEILKGAKGAKVRFIVDQTDLRDTSKKDSTNPNDYNTGLDVGWTVDEVVIIMSDGSEYVIKTNTP